MKKLLLCAGALACALAAPAVASAEENYLQVTGGLVAGGRADVTVQLPGWPALKDEGEVKPGWFVAAAYGATQANGFGVQAEVLGAGSTIKTDLFDDTKGRVAAVMIKGLYEFKAVGPVRPYVGAGAGFGRVRMEADGESESNGGLALQGRAGVIWTDGSGRTWDVGYRYVAPPKLRVSDGGVDVEVETRLHVVSVGLRF